LSGFHYFFLLKRKAENEYRGNAKHQLGTGNAKHQLGTGNAKLQLGTGNAKLQLGVPS